MIDIEISGTLVPFLYDPGSQYYMITHNVYDSLSAKPRLATYIIRLNSFRIIFMKFITWLEKR